MDITARVIVISFVAAVVLAVIIGVVTSITEGAIAWRIEAHVARALNTCRICGRPCSRSVGLCPPCQEVCDLGVTRLHPPPSR